MHPKELPLVGDELLSKSGAARYGQFAAELVKHLVDQGCVGMDRAAEASREAYDLAFRLGTYMEEKVKKAHAEARQVAGQPAEPETQKPTALMKFGKHKGTPLRAVPDEYLDWFMEQEWKDKWADVVGEYRRRRASGQTSGRTKGGEGLEQLGDGKGNGGPF